MFRLLVFMKSANLYNNKYWFILLFINLSGFERYLAKKIIQVYFLSIVKIVFVFVSSLVENQNEIY